jgi:hypothetical protein
MGWVKFRRKCTATEIKYGLDECQYSTAEDGKVLSEGCKRTLALIESEEYKEGEDEFGSLFDSRR